MTTATKPQHLAALERANEVRLAHHAIRRQVKAGEITVSEVLYLHADTVATMKLCDLIRSQRAWGEGRTRKLLGMIQLPYLKRCGDLTDRQRNLVCQFIEGRI
jgi:hypothetical protein